MTANSSANGAPPQSPKIQYVCPSEFLRRLIARDEATGFEGAPPYCVIFQPGLGLFQESIGRWIACADEARFRFDRLYIFEGDAKKARGHHAGFIDFMLERDPSLWRKIKTWFSLRAPYLYRRLKNGGWLALNRFYAPLGLPRGTWDYEAFGADAERFVSDPAALESIWSALSDRGDAAWLYDDAPTSRKDYFQRWLKLDDHVALPGEAAPY
jgi:hypothetical protein